MGLVVVRTVGAVEDDEAEHVGRAALGGAAGAEGCLALLERGHGGGGDRGGGEGEEGGELHFEMLIKREKYTMLV